MINAYLTDDIVVKKVTEDKWGTKTEKKTLQRGRIEFKTRLVRNLQGEQVVSSATVTLPDIVIDFKDTIEYDNKEYAILNIEHIKDFSKQFIKLGLA